MKKESIDLFKKLYLEHKDNLLGIAILYLKDYHLAQDAVQETFFKVFEKLSTLDTVKNKTAWITTITVNICKNKLKRSNRQTFHRIAFRPVNVRKYKQKRSVRL